MGNSTSSNNPDEVLPTNMIMRSLDPPEVVSSDSNIGNNTRSIVPNENISMEIPSSSNNFRDEVDNVTNMGNKEKSIITDEIVSSETPYSSTTIRDEVHEDTIKPFQGNQIRVEGLIGIAESPQHTNNRFSKILHKKKNIKKIKDTQLTHLKIYYISLGI